MIRIGGMPPSIPQGKVVRECNDRIIYRKKEGVGLVPLPECVRGKSLLSPYANYIGPYLIAPCSLLMGP